MITVYGIKTCSTVRKALGWLAETQVPARFHDYRADGLDPAVLDRFIAELGWEALLNRKGTTWRGLSDAEKADMDAAKARALMLAQPALIKRPVFELPDATLLLGFTPTQQAALAATRSNTP
jgi:arsenate reductase (glutaredoxin)